MATLSLSDDREPQWAVRPLNQHGIVTNWGHETPAGDLVARRRRQRRPAHHAVRRRLPGRAATPPTPAAASTTLGLPWLLGGYEYGGKIDQIFHGWLGDVRIAGRALPIGAFMNA